MPKTPSLCTFESRRADEMLSLIQRFGGQATVAPSMKEVPVDQNAPAIDAIRHMIDGQVQHLILLTGVGTEEMLRLAAHQQLESQLLEVMKTIPIYVRGPKPAAVLSRLGLKFTVKAPEPNTWQDLMQALTDAGISLDGSTVAVQEYGIASTELHEALKSRNAAVLPISVYRWALPDDVAALENAVRGTIAGQFDALLFTSAQQVRHVLMIADRLNLRSEWLMAAAETCVASIGPTCSEALREEGLQVTVEASPPKMGPLVRAVMESLAVC
ncbi:MAG: uroporphyrinogen-III synthase [Planctomycetaceae bacterium]